jgi:aminopeptidase N
MTAARILTIFALAACKSATPAPDAPPGPIDPTANLARDVTDTQLHFDLAALTATATITFAPSTSPGASLEIGDLTFDSVQWNGADLPYVIGGKQMDLGLPADSVPISIDVAYHFTLLTGFDGPNKAGWTLDWPYFCGNTFPCHSEPADGTTFTADIANVPAGMTAVYPATLTIAPSYQFAWTYDAYTELPLGTTTAGTQISVWYRPGELATAQMGSAHLVAAFDWLEQTLGPYRFGPKFSEVSVNWPRGAYGGMEHHPNVHIGSTAFGDEAVQTHEASHGWFGDGIRIQCWEDFVLSEGTVSYLEGRVLDVVDPPAGAQVWQGYENELTTLPGTGQVWLQTCGKIDILQTLWKTRAPYVRGGLFYKAVADKVGAAQLDTALATFFQLHGGGTARMADMLQTIQDVTGYDPTACAQTWLLSTTSPTPGPCP